MTTTRLTPTRLEMVRLTREWCYTMIGAAESKIVDTAYVQSRAMATLDTSVEELAGWIVPGETVLANIRLLVDMANQPV